MMIFKIREKLESTAAGHVLHAQAARMESKIREKQELTVEDHVLRAKVCGIGPNDISITKRFYSHIILSRSHVCLFLF